MTGFCFKCSHLLFRDYGSPPSSPTGTISVPNSCPTSPNGHRIFNPYSHYRPVTQHTPTLAHIELEETKPDLSLLTHNAVVYPTEDGGLSTVPVDPSPSMQVIIPCQWSV